MENLTLYQLLKNNPYLKKQTDRILIIDEKENEYYRNDPNKVMDISVSFLKRLLTDDKYYQYVEKLTSSYIDVLSTRFIRNDELTGGVDLTRVDLTKCLEEVIKKDNSLFDEQFIRRFQDLKELTSYDQFLKEYKDKEYQLEVDGKKISIPISKLINFISLDEQKYEQILNGNGLIEGIKKEHFLYACCSFFDNHNIFDNYIVPQKFIRRFDELMSFQKIDFQSVNAIPNSINPSLDQITIDSKLKDAILEGINDNDSDIEKAVYIYIKMCKLLTYDDEYYVKGQISDHTNKHSDINNISKITLENNKVICTEFTAIFSMFLKKLGLNYLVQPEGGEYGKGHSWLKFVGDKFIVNADAALSILYGDLARAKFNKPLEGLKCLNENEETRNEFLELINSIYQRIIEEEKKKEDFEKVVSRYQQITSNLKEMPLDERLRVMTDKVKNDNVRGIDLLFDILQLKRMFFTEKELKNNISILFVKDNTSEKEPTIGTIFVLNDINVKINTLNNRYYVFDANGNITSISRSNLQEKFDDKTLEYTVYNDLRVPGITESKGDSNVRKAK
ncbi:MAG: hypothetical protein J6A52_01390 [Bacilli bacterium]|nr:hypothetical protein [Bacilli bacterium]